MAPKPKKTSKAQTVGQYLAGLSPDKRAALERLRGIIRGVAPGAEEGISYDMPGFRVDGKWVVWIGAAANHCAVYGLAETHRGELKDYDTSGRGTIRFQPDAPLPAALVRKLLKARIAKNAAHAGRAAVSALLLVLGIAAQGGCGETAKQEARDAGAVDAAAEDRPAGDVAEATGGEVVADVEADGPSVDSDAEEAPVRCEAIDGALAQCAATYDDQLMVLMGECVGGGRGQMATCGRYMILTSPVSLDPGKSCFYDATSKKLLAYEYCSDTPDPRCPPDGCRYAGESVESDCSWSRIWTSGRYSAVCKPDGGPADSGLRD